MTYMVSGVETLLTLLDFFFFAVSIKSVEVTVQTFFV